MEGDDGCGNKVNAGSSRNWRESAWLQHSEGWEKALMSNRVSGVPSVGPSGFIHNRFIVSRLVIEQIFWTNGSFPIMSYSLITMT